jgi:hypothetical protein
VANITAALAGFTTNIFFSNFDDPGSPNYLNATEAGFAVGDSGGPVYTLNGGGWQLSGWNLYTAPDPVVNAGQPGNTVGPGNLLIYGTIAAVRPNMLAIMVPEPQLVGWICLLGAAGAGKRRRDVRAHCHLEA